VQSHPQPTDRACTNSSRDADQDRSFLRWVFESHLGEETGRGAVCDGDACITALASSKTRCSLREGPSDPPRCRADRRSWRLLAGSTWNRSRGPWANRTPGCRTPAPSANGLVSCANDTHSESRTLESSKDSHATSRPSRSRTRSRGWRRSARALGADDGTELVRVGSPGNILHRVACSSRSWPMTTARAAARFASTTSWTTRLPKRA
jgi:hypothetical protein